MAIDSLDGGKLINPQVLKEDFSRRYWYECVRDSVNSPEGLEFAFFISGVVGAVPADHIPHAGQFSMTTMGEAMIGWRAQYSNKITKNKEVPMKMELVSGNVDNIPALIWCLTPDVNINRQQAWSLTPDDIAAARDDLRKYIAAGEFKPSTINATKIHPGESILLNKNNG